MSIIAAVRSTDAITIAADSLAVFGEGLIVPANNARVCKLMRIGDAVLGGTGWAVYDDIIDHHLADKPPPSLNNRRDIYAFFLDLWSVLREKYTLVNDQAASKDTPFGDLDASFLVASPGGLFKVSSDLGVTEFTRWYAVGSGSEYAMGAMHALRDRVDEDAVLVTHACQAAIDMDAHCGGDIDIIQIECQRQ
jgi:ATP-dependent HslUV protease subunit HslV